MLAECRQWRDPIAMQLTSLPPVKVLGGLKQCGDAHFGFVWCVRFFGGKFQISFVFASSASVTALKLRYLMQV